MGWDRKICPMDKPGDSTNSTRVNIWFDSAKKLYQLVIKDIAIGAEGLGFTFRVYRIGHNYPVLKSGGFKGQRVCCIIIIFDSKSFLMS